MQRTQLFLLPALVIATLAAPSTAQVETPIGNEAAADVPPGEPAAPQQIALESPDPEIAERLNGLFAELEGLDEVRARVSGGVVTLTGIVLSAEDQAKAETVAARLAGVVSVENEIEIEHRVGRRIEPMIAKVNEFVSQTVAFLPLLLVSLVVFLAVWLLGRLMTRPAVLRRLVPNPLVQTLVAQAIRLAFILLGLVLAMRIMGATALLGTVLGAAGVLGLAVGFAVRDTIENYIASILLSIRRPFSPNDHVILEGYEGRVTRLNSRATFITTMDGNEVRIPNAIVYKSKITNFTEIPERRFEFGVGVGYENDLCRALATALSATKSADGVLATPEPDVQIDALEASTVSILVRGWVDQRASDFGKVRSAAIRAVKTAFDEEGISMPEPIQNVRAIDDARRKAPRASKAEVDAVSDTSADRTIEGKVDALRSKSEEDLLTTAAPKE